MKNVLLVFSLFISSLALAGGLKFEKALENEILFLKDSKTFGEYGQAAKNIRSIADSNTGRWEGFYWAAYALLRQASVCENPVEKNQILKTADHYIYRTNLIKPNYDELYVLRAWYFMELIQVSPNPNQQKYGDQKEDWFKKAYEANGTNPRYYYIKAYEEFNKGPENPEQREKARSYFLAAVQMFNENPEPRYGKDPLKPNWGRDDAELMSILLEGIIAEEPTEGGMLDEVDGEGGMQVEVPVEEAPKKEKKGWFKKKKKKEKK